MDKLKTDYNDAIYTGNKKYNLVNNDDGTISLEDKTVYYQKDDTTIFGATDINQITKSINDINEKHENGTLALSIDKFETLDEDDLDTKVALAVSKRGKLYKVTIRALFEYLRKSAQKLSEPKDVYWNNGTWTCPADGFITICVGADNSTGYTLVYISDAQSDIKCSVYGQGTGGTFTSMFPVHKGVSYKTFYAVGVKTIKAMYTKLG